MHSDNLIKKLLNAAAICEIAYLAVYGIVFLLLNLFINGMVGGADFLETVSLYLPEFIKTMLTAGGFFGVWYLLKRAVDPRFFKSVNGVFLAAFVMFSNITSIIANYIFNFRITRFRLENMSRLVMGRTYSSLVGYIASAAVLLLWIAFGMEWYRDSLIREQTANQQFINNKT